MTRWVGGESRRYDWKDVCSMASQQTCNPAVRDASSSSTFFSNAVVLAQIMSRTISRRSEGLSVSSPWSGV